MGLRSRKGVLRSGSTFSINFKNNDVFVDSGGG